MQKFKIRFSIDWKIIKVINEFSNKLKVPIILLSKKFLGDSIDLST